MSYSFSPFGGGGFKVSQSLTYRGGDTPDDVIGSFNDICIKSWMKGSRPSLPVLAATLLDNKGVDVNRPPADESEAAIIRATLAVAARAENDGEKNPYHNASHTGHVATMTHWLSEKNDDLAADGHAQELSRKDCLILLLAALAHDVGHPGTSNPKEDRFFNERASVNEVLPILKAAGVSDQDSLTVGRLVLATSPNGPHDHIKAALKAHAAGRAFAAPPDFPDLAPLLADKKLTQMAAVLSDADLFTSAGAGMDANREMNRRMTEEAAKAGRPMDFNTHEAQLYFLQVVVGRDGFASDAGKACFNDSFHAMLDHRLTQKAQAEAAKPSLPVPQ